MRRAVADLAHQPAGGPTCAPGRKFPTVTPRTEAEDDRNVEVSKIEGRGTVRRNPEEGQAGPDGKGKSAAGDSGTRGEAAGPPPAKEAADKKAAEKTTAKNK